MGLSTRCSGIGDPSETLGRPLPGSPDEMPVVLGLPHSVGSMGIPGSGIPGSMTSTSGNVGLGGSGSMREAGDVGDASERTTGSVDGGGGSTKIIGGSVSG